MAILRDAILIVEPCESEKKIITYVHIRKSFFVVFAELLKTLVKKFIACEDGYCTPNLQDLGFQITTMCSENFCFQIENTNGDSVCLDPNQIMDLALGRAHSALKIFFRQ